MIAFTPLLLILIKLVYSKSNDQCTKSNTLWDSLKYPFIDVLKVTSKPSIFKCPVLSSQSCCSSEMNNDMITVSQQKLKGIIEEKIETVLMMFSNDSFELMNIFINDLESTKNDLNQLFSTTYGYNYKVHRDFFYDWFEKLKLYMQGKLHNISGLLDNFFKEMTVKIVRILIAPDSTNQVTSCHTERLLESKPFHDTDVMLKARIVRAYPPARLLVNGIAVGRDVFGDIFKNTNPSEKCVEQFNIAFHCMLCGGLTIKSCPKSCNTIMDNCFGSYRSSDIKKLDRVFSKYTKSLVQLAIKLDNPFNFPEVNNKMNVQISSAIMNVQSMYPTLKEQIKEKCQEGGASPRISRNRRQASQEFYNWQGPNKNNRGNPWWEQTLNKNMNEDNKEKQDFNSYPSKPNDSLSPFVKKIKQNYKALENYFKEKKVEICSSMSTVDPSVDCWNGSSAIKNTKFLTVKDSKKVEKIDDPIIKSSINQLNEITKRINSNIKGENLDPETVPVKPYKLYASQKVKTATDNDRKNTLTEKVEGSGEADNSNFPQPNLKTGGANNDKKLPKLVPQSPEKNNWEFPTLPEGSGNVYSKVQNERTNKTPKKPRKLRPKISSSTSSYISSSTKPSGITHTKPSTASPNQIPDDEDLNPSKETLSKKNSPVVPEKIPPAIHPEIQSSGNGPVLPDLSPNKPFEPSSISTKRPKPPVIDGSGDEKIPKPSVDRDILPMIPDPSKAVTEPLKKAPQKPNPNPDEDLSPLEGSGSSSEPKPTQSMTLARPVVETTKPSSESLPPDQLPGKVPAEVWVPRVEGVKNEEKDHQRTTPTGTGSTTLCLCRTTVILLSFMCATL